MKFKIQTDGASRGNPGQASYGFVITQEDGDYSFKEGKRLGIATNNIAEYTAVLEGLKHLIAHFGTDLKSLEVDVVGDSQLVAQQLSGNYKVKNENLRVLFDQIKSLEYEFQNVTFRNVPREQNKEADKMANLALDNRL